MGWLDSIRDQQTAATATTGDISTAPFTAPLYLNSSGLPTWKSPYFLDPVTGAKVDWNQAIAEYPQWADLGTHRTNLLNGSVFVEKWTVAKYGPEYSSGDDFRFGPDGRTIANDPFPWALAAVVAVPIAAPFLLPVVGTLTGVAAVTGAAATTVQRVTASPIEAPPIVTTLQAQYEADAAKRAAELQRPPGLLDALNDPTVQIALVGVVIIAVLAARK